MRRGTLSLLLGAHQVVLHPICVTLAWHRIHETWPAWDEAIAILVHDWGYLGCQSMDGLDGERHPEMGAKIAGKVVGWFGGEERGLQAEALVRGHSRTYARIVGMSPSKLMAPDKLALCYVPSWIYVPGARLTGEMAEYRDNCTAYYERTGDGVPRTASDWKWFSWVCDYMERAAQGKANLVTDRSYSATSASSTVERDEEFTTKNTKDTKDRTS